LARDQHKKLEGLFRKCSLPTTVNVYDGDTDPSCRKAIRENTQILITNPDMLHSSILPFHSKWRSFLKFLKFVVVDEIHIFSGNFGCHASLLFRRLKRILDCINAPTPIFILLSATIGNPLEHAKNLTNEKDFKLISKDGSFSSAKRFLLWNISNTYEDSALLLLTLCKGGLKSLLFCRSRSDCEIVISECQRIISKNNVFSSLKNKIFSYRGGYMQKIRREIEQNIFNGEIIGLVCTSALELGIDIGSINVTLHLGMPSSVSSLWQQAGRAGRNTKESLCFLLLPSNNNPSKLFFDNHPEQLVSGMYESIYINSQCHYIVKEHLICAAAEIPFSIENDIKYFGDQTETLASTCLVKNGNYLLAPKEFLPNPALHFSLRSKDTNDNLVVYNDCEILEILEMDRALKTIYPGGIFLNRGNTFIVKFVNYAKKEATVSQCKVEYITSPLSTTTVINGSIYYSNTTGLSYGSINGKDSDLTQKKWI
jgi:DEAD/DEAH box helicase domain-containing protein